MQEINGAINHAGFVRFFKSLETRSMREFCIVDLCPLQALFTLGLHAGSDQCPGSGSVKSLGFQESPHKERPVLRVLKHETASTVSMDLSPVSVDLSPNAFQASGSPDRKTAFHGQTCDSCTNTDSGVFDRRESAFLCEDRSMSDSELVTLRGGAASATRLPPPPPRHSANKASPRRGQADGRAGG